MCVCVCEKEAHSKEEKAEPRARVCSQKIPNTWFYQKCESSVAAALAELRSAAFGRLSRRP